MSPHTHKICVILVFRFTHGGAYHSGMATHQPHFDVLELTELLNIKEVEVRTKMKRSWIYELIKRGEFPAPIHMGGSKWIAAEVEEYIQRQVDERDRESGENKFVPRAQVLQFPSSGARSMPPSVREVVESAAGTESTLRVLNPELCGALRTLRMDIPELYLDQDAWQVNLLVMKINLSPTPPPKGKVKSRGKQY
jgi:prophage regulatory protein